jgi:hypothetical protein
MANESKESHLQMCKMFMMYKIQHFDKKKLGELFYTPDEFRTHYGCTDFSVETNVAASTELAQAGDLDIFYQVECSHCVSLNSIMEKDPMNGKSINDLANGLTQCKYCGCELQVDMKKKNPFVLLYRLSKKHVASNSESHVLRNDENEPDNVVQKSIVRRMLNSLRGKS